MVANKKFFLTLSLVIAVVGSFLVGPSVSVLIADSYRSATGTGTTSVTTIVPGVPNEYPEVISYVADGDDVNSIATFYFSTHPEVTTGVHANSTADTLHVNGTTGFTADPSSGDWISLQEADGTVEVNRISSFTDGTHMLLYSSVANAKGTDTVVKKLSAAYTVPIGINTTPGGPFTIGGPLVGPKGSPVMMHLDGTTAVRATLSVHTAK